MEQESEYVGWSGSQPAGGGVHSGPADDLGVEDAALPLVRPAQYCSDKAKCGRCQQGL